MSSQGASGKNVTPVDFPKGAAKDQVLRLCDDALVEAIRYLKTKVVVGIGRYAVQRAERAMEEAGVEGVRVVFMNHPSPASASANKGGGWKKMAVGQLKEAGVLDIIQQGKGKKQEQQQQQHQEQQKPATQESGEEFPALHNINREQQQNVQQHQLQPTLSEELCTIWHNSLPVPTSKQ